MDLPRNADSPRRSLSAFGAPRVPWSDMKLSLRDAPLPTDACPTALRVSAAIVWRPVMPAIAEFGLVDEHGNGSRRPCSSGGLPEDQSQFAPQVAVALRRRQAATTRF
jgi:hypothetical protein